MRTNTLKQKLKDGRAVFGAMITFPSPPIVEMLGYTWDSKHILKSWLSWKRV